MACYEAETYILVYNTLYCIVYIVHWEVGWPLPLPWICLLLLIPGLHCHPIAGTHGQCRPGKCPPFSAYLKEAEFPMAQKKPVSFPCISFLLTVNSVKYVYFMLLNAALDLFPLERSCTFFFFHCCRLANFALYIAWNLQFQHSLWGSAAWL